MDQSRLNIHPSHAAMRQDFDRLYGDFTYWKDATLPLAKVTILPG